MPDLLQWLGRLPPEAYLVPPVLIIGGLVAGIVIRESVRLGHYRAIAARTGLSVKRGFVNPSQVHGMFDGRHVEMTIASPRGIAWRQRNGTCVAVELKHPGLVNLRIAPKDVFDRMLGIDGDVQTGDARFDRRYVIRTRDRGAATRIFHDPKLRESMLGVNVSVSVAETMSDAVWVFSDREIRDPAHAEQFFTTAVQLASAMDGVKFP